MHFDINTYDMIQRATTTADALNKLGASEAQAGYEAAEGILNDVDHTIAERAYTIESISSKGPQVNKKIVFNHILQNANIGSDATYTVEDFIEALEVGVLASATSSEKFGAKDGVPTFNLNPPKEFYDAEPEKIIAVFTNGVDTSENASEAAAKAINTHEKAIAQLSLTSLAIVIQYLNTEYNVDPEVNAKEILSDTQLNTIGKNLFEKSLEAYIRQHN